MVRSFLRNADIHAVVPGFRVRPFAVQVEIQRFHEFLTGSKQEQIPDRNDFFGKLVISEGANCDPKLCPALDLLSVEFFRLCLTRCIQSRSLANVFR